ncbi:MAG TPA: IclR family transcriptional regulator [Solirubrobacteraceae bacterium]|nr:IclR family transcriptional regulator [Solirubrobacteraceae bacterium]
MTARRAAGSRREVGSVARAIALLDALAESEAGVGVNELARRIGVNASTASRLLATLEQGGLVERAPGGPYRLGLKLVALSDRVLSRLDVRERARPWLLTLVDETGETATLSVPGAGAAITVDVVPAPSSVVSMARLGRPSVSHATAAGKVMLAFGGDAALSRGTELTAYTERTITDPDALVRELAVVRERGIAEAVGEREPDLAAMAAPVLGRGDELVAILGVQGPVGRLPAAKRRALEQPLRRAAAEVGRLLGGTGAT